MRLLERDDSDSLRQTSETKHRDLSFVVLDTLVSVAEDWFGQTFADVKEIGEIWLKIK